MMDYLVKHSARPQGSVVSGYIYPSPLMFASYGGNPDAVKWLIAKGADKNYSVNLGNAYDLAINDEIKYILR